MGVKKPNQLTIVEARKGLKNKEFKIVDLVQACLERIKETDSKINAFITLSENDSLKLARKCDQAFKPFIFEKKPLFGIPVAVKDNFCTKGIRTTAGANVLKNFIPPYGATVVEKLKNAGAIIIGKTNMDAWAHGSSTEASDFFTTKNPHDPSRVAGGSSGGSTAAVAADQVICAIGSETAGSIRQPASWSGVVGLKPTYGRVSRWGLIAMCSSTDSPGPIAKTVEDSAIILSVIAGQDSKDATSAKIAPEAYEQNLKINPKQITLAVPKEYFSLKMDPGVKKTVQEAIKNLLGLGFRVKEVSLLAPKYSVAVYTIIQRAEVSSNLARYDGIRYGHERKRFGEEAKRRIILGTHVLSSGYYDQYYLEAQKVRTLIRDDFEKVFKTSDAIIAPTSPTTALKTGASKKSFMFGEIQDILVEASSLAGLPGININCGWIDNLPVGLQIFAPQFQESLILKIAHAYEKNCQ